MKALQSHFDVELHVFKELLKWRSWKTAVLALDSRWSTLAANFQSSHTGLCNSTRNIHEFNRSQSCHHIIISAFCWWDQFAHSTNIKIDKKKANRKPDIGENSQAINAVFPAETFILYWFRWFQCYMSLTKRMLPSGSLKISVQLPERSYGAIVTIRRPDLTAQHFMLNLLSFGTLYDFGIPLSLNASITVLPGHTFWVDQFPRLNRLLQCSMDTRQLLYLANSIDPHDSSTDLPC